MNVKYYNLKRGDKVDNGDGILTFNKMDGMYAQLMREDGATCLVRSIEYELKDGIYYPVTI